MVLLISKVQKINKFVIARRNDVAIWLLAPNESKLVRPERIIRTRSPRCARDDDKSKSANFFPTFN